MNYKLVMTVLAAFLLGIFVGYYAGYDIGFESAVDLIR